MILPGVSDIESSGQLVYSSGCNNSVPVLVRVPGRRAGQRPRKCLSIYEKSKSLGSGASMVIRCTPRTDGSQV